MDGNSNPDGAKKRGERFWGGFFVSLFVKTVKLKEKKRGIRMPSNTYQQKESQQTEPAANRVATQGEIRSSPAFFL